MKQVRLSLLALVLPLFLSSCLFSKVLGVPSDCNNYTKTVAFPDDPKLLRGEWQGTLLHYPNEDDSTPIRLNLTPSYLDERSYQVTGTFTLDGMEPRRLEGKVTGGCFERYIQSTNSNAKDAATATLELASYPPSTRFFAEVFDQNDTLLWEMRASVAGFDTSPGLQELDLYSHTQGNTWYTAPMTKIR